MKTLTCAQLGGSCDYSMTAATEADLSRMGWQHLAESHPKKMEEMGEMTPEQKEAGMAHFHQAWEKASENAA